MNRIAPMGIIALPTKTAPLPGMVTHASTWRFPTVCEWLPGEDLVERVVTGDPSLEAEVLAAGKRLAAQGVSCIATSCGYFSVFQSALAGSSPCPVFTSPLLQLPTLLASLGPDETVTVVWAAQSEAVAPALRAAGAADGDPRIVNVAMPAPGRFFGAVIEGSEEFDDAAVAAEVLNVIGAAGTGAAGTGRGTGPVLLECGDLCWCTDFVKSNAGRPVYGYESYLQWAWSAAGLRIA